MTTPNPSDVSAQNGQAELEALVTRVARRAADNLAPASVDLGVQLALAQESLDNMASALGERGKQAEEKDRQLAAKDAELARVRETCERLQTRIAELEASPAGDGGDDGCEEAQT